MVGRVARPRDPVPSQRGAGLAHGAARGVPRLLPTCAALGVATASYYRRLKPKPAAPPRPTPARALGASERAAVLGVLHEPPFVDLAPTQVYAHLLDEGRDRKSTRLNSSHGYISYAVFCLKK